MGAEDFFYLKRRNTMAYTKPQVIAQNASSGSYAAGCPAKDRGYDSGTGLPSATGCTNCERTK